MMTPEEMWLHDSLAKLRLEGCRTSDTHMYKVPLPSDWAVDLYVKDESTHPTGSLKHRLARSLFEWALVSGYLTKNSEIIESSSGSTAVSEAYFAKLLGLEFTAVMPASTSKRKIAEIERYGGKCHLVDNPHNVALETEQLASRPNAFNMNQFQNADVVSDWRGDSSMGASILRQLESERYPIPSWIVVGAGTGGTSAAVSRYCRWKGIDSRVAVVDPEGSVFFDAWKTGRRDLKGEGSLIEGIGRPRVEISFIPSAIHEMLQVSNSQSIAGLYLLEELTGLRGGGSTGTNFYGAIKIAARMARNGEQGSVVTLMCDPGERYQDTYYDPQWLMEQEIDVDEALSELRALIAEDAV